MEYDKIETPSFVKTLNYHESSETLLTEIGWKMCCESGLILDHNHQPIPWYNYSAVEFLKSRLNDKLVIFEYGSGFSTLFYASRVCEVVASEINQECHDWVQTSLNKIGAKNVQLALCDRENFASSVTKHNKKFDIIIVDSINRNECIRQSVSYLTDAGIIILDNSERQQYVKSFAFLEELGFRHITFTGIKALSTKISSTTVFYKDKNVFKI